MMRKALIILRTSIKLITVFIMATLLIVGIIVFIYKPIYKVSLNGEFIGYSKDKQELQEKIKNYIDKGEGEHVAFVQIDDFPTYELCLLKKGIVTNDDEIYETVKNTGTVYYKFYAVALNNEEKEYVGSFSEAEEVINKLKEKNSANIDNLSIIEKYSTELSDLVITDKAVSDLYEEKKVVKKVVLASNTSVATTKTKTGPKIDMKFNYPVSSPVISSRFGQRWGRTHQGLDLAAPTGTSIYASASGTVTFAGWNSGGYGYLVVISHANGVQTYYAHCSAILCSVGQTVSQGNLIAKVGNTGNSYGSHCHFEIRVDGVAYNPELYL